MINLHLSFLGCDRRFQISLDIAEALECLMLTLSVAQAHMFVLVVLALAAFEKTQIWAHQDGLHEYKMKR